MEFIHQDWVIFNIVKQSKGAIDIYNLKLTSKFYYEFISFNDIKNVIIRNIIDRLQMHVHVKFEELIQFMQENELILFGEFITQCILNETWTEYSIEFHTLKSIPNQQNIFLKNGYFLNEFDDFDQGSVGYKFTSNYDNQFEQIIFLTNDLHENKFLNSNLNIHKNNFCVKNDKYLLNQIRFIDVINRKIKINDTINWPIDEDTLMK
jgi:hypothetical protein